MQSVEYYLGDCRFTLYLEKDIFIGLGTIFIGDTCVRSGRLPLRPRSQTFSALTIGELSLSSVSQQANEIRIVLNASFTPLDVKMLRDHSFDPIHNIDDWDTLLPAGSAEITLVLQTAEDSFNGINFYGFSYHYEYDSQDTAIFYLLDLASWEIDGDIIGATIISQSACSAPVVTITPDKNWTTEGVMHWADPVTEPNMVMTHNLPRWASHQSFDFQYRGDTTLIGIFQRVELIRSILCHQAGKAELKTIDKHIFDQTTHFSTSPKTIMINTDAKSRIDQQNIWTWIFDETSTRARAEFGLQEEAVLPRISLHFSKEKDPGFTFDNFRRDILPAAQALGIPRIFISNVHKSAETACSPHPLNRFNQCCGHEYEVDPALGGVKALKRLADDCREEGIAIIGWSNNDQAISSPLNHWYKPEYTSWYVRMEDCRSKYGGAYMHNFHIWSFNHEPARRYWIDCLKQTREQTGVAWHLFDSFYNLGFMPVDYKYGTPRTHWRKLLASFRELQQAGVHFYIESFGPFGAVMHGCPPSYNMDNLFACYKIGLGTGYTTIPGDQQLVDTTAKHASELYRTLAHMTDPNIPLFIESQRIDTLWGEEHRRVLAEYLAAQPAMFRRYLQPDECGVLWHCSDGKFATFFNFIERSLALPGTIHEVSSGAEMPPANCYHLQASHTYTMSNIKNLPIKV